MASIGVACKDGASIYREQGLDGVLEIKQSPGRPRVIPAWATASLQRRLEQANYSFKSYIQVQQWRLGNFRSQSRVSHGASAHTLPTQRQTQSSSTH